MLDAAAKKTGDDISAIKADLVETENELKSAIDALPAKLNYTKTLQVFDVRNIIDNKSINSTTGAFQSDQNYWVSGYIKIAEAAEKFITNTASNGVYFYNSAYEYLGRQSTVNADTTYTFAFENAAYIVFRYSKSYTPIANAPKIIVSFGETLSDTMKLYIDSDDIFLENMQMVYADTMSAGSSLQLAVPDVKKGNQIAFHAEFSTFGKLIISHGQNQPYSSAKVEVDNINIYVYGYLNSAWTLYGTYPHGLPMGNGVDIIINVNNNLTANVIVSSNGSSYEKQNVVWNGNAQYVKAEVESGSYSKCKLIFGCSDFNKNLWIFGDSYLDMWPKILVEKGIDNFYLDGFSGRNSVQAIASFREAIKHGKPKYLAWFLGMNDRDGKITGGVSDATGINQNWKDAYNEVNDWCMANGVELILSTIPEVPSRDHTYKNAFVKHSSGKRYVDVASSVGATSLGSHWFNYGDDNAYLANDEVHPSNPYGRTAIATVMLANIPEMR